MKFVNESKKKKKKNPLAKAAQYHNKRQKGLPYNFNPNAGDVEAANAFFNNAVGNAGSPSTSPCGPMGEDIEKPKFSKSDLSIKDALNQIDNSISNPCLLNMYLSVDFTDDEKLHLANMITSDDYNINDIYEYLLNKQELNEAYRWADDTRDELTRALDDVLDIWGDWQASQLSRLKMGYDLSEYTDAQILQAAKDKGLYIKAIDSDLSYDGSDDDFILAKDYTTARRFINDLKSNNFEPNDDDYYAVWMDAYIEEDLYDEFDDAETLGERQAIVFRSCKRVCKRFNVAYGGAKSAGMDNWECLYIGRIPQLKKIYGLIDPGNPSDFDQVIVDAEIVSDEVYRHYLNKY